MLSFQYYIDSLEFTVEADIDPGTPRCHRTGDEGFPREILGVNMTYVAQGSKKLYKVILCPMPSLFVDDLLKRLDLEEAIWTEYEKQLERDKFDAAMDSLVEGQI